VKVFGRTVQFARSHVLHPIGHRAATLAVDVGRTALHWAYVGQRDAERLGFGAFGTGSMLQQPYAVLMGEAAIHVGDETLLSPGITLAASPEFEWSDSDDPIISIGSRVWAARGLTVVAHRSVTIGDDVWFGPNVYVTDASHEMDDPDHPIGQRMEPAQPVMIGDGAWLGTGVVVLPGVTIGRNVAVGANSVVASDLPDHTVAVGSPAKVVRELTPR
jgi:acetyltransferase-like isoleucine patch superfamily enzyme